MLFTYNVRIDLRGASFDDEQADHPVVLLGIAAALVPRAAEGVRAPLIGLWRKRRDDEIVAGGDVVGRGDSELANPREAVPRIGSAGNVDVEEDERVGRSDRRRSGAETGPPGEKSQALTEMTICCAAAGAAVRGAGDQDRIRGRVVDDRGVGEERRGAAAVDDDDRVRGRSARRRSCEDVVDLRAGVRGSGGRARRPDERRPVVDRNSGVTAVVARVEDADVRAESGAGPPLRIDVSTVTGLAAEIGSPGRTSRPSESGAVA